ncbi:MAG: polysaccharide biosynthesis/export family protein [Pseudomonadota bacterium]
MLRILAVSTLSIGLAACGIPRGAAIVSEVTSGTESADFVVYPVTRTFLPQVSEWPVTGESSSTWLGYSTGPQDRVIQPGDTLSITIWDASDRSLLSTPGSPATPLGDLRVSSGGSVFVPYAGNIQVAGNTPQAARLIVERAVEDLVPSAQVQLSMVEGSANTASVVSGAARPGRYPLPDRSFTVLDLIAEAGGVSPVFENPTVKLHRGREYYSISASTLYENPTRDVPIRPGDQVFVEEDSRFFISLGASGREEVHPFTKDDISAAEAMAIAGGVQDTRGDPGGILVLREYPVSAIAPGVSGPQKQRVVFSIDLTSADGLFSARKFRVNSEDLIYVTEAPVTGAQTIANLVGTGFGLVNSAGNL